MGLYKVRTRLARALHDWGCRDILTTAPLAIRDAPLIICSMVSQRDLIMYMVAIKSAYMKLGEGRIAIINDGSLESDSIELLNRHLGSPDIAHIDDIDTGPCPRGGTWERLLHLLDLAERAYVIQLDSDVLVGGPIPEVAECYRSNRSFTLASWNGQAFTDLVNAAQYAKAAEGGHIQILAERALDRLDRPSEKKYVRGCSGFAGFARGSSRRDAEEFSVKMQAMIGSRWADWGSEQVTSNYIVANSAGACVLPLPKYLNFLPHVPIDEAAVLHFMGETRFHHARYMRESRRVIAQLAAARAD